MFLGSRSTSVVGLDPTQFLRFGSQKLIDEYLKQGVFHEGLTALFGQFQL
jgi:hypothetical protein